MISMEDAMGRSSDGEELRQLIGGGGAAVVARRLASAS
jgi:hypothetical protein